MNEGRGAPSMPPASGNGAAGGAVPADRTRSGRKERPRAEGRRRRKTPERVARRPDPAQWGEDELMGLHEAVALMFAAGPLTVSSLRTAIGRGELAHARIANRIYTTLAALSAMAECRRTSGRNDGRMSAEAWEARLSTLLPKRGGSDR